MGFRSIVSKTLIDLTGWKRTLILLILGLSVPVASGVFWRFGLEEQALSPEMETHSVLNRFIVVNFVWTAGIFLAFAVVISAAGSISKEAGDGTLLTLVSKPISRRQIVLGKFAGIVVHALLLEAALLLIQSIILWFVLPVEAPTFGALLAAIPWIIVYSLLVILVFGAISLALSSLLDSQVVITVIACALVLFVFIFGPISQTFIHQTAYENNYVYMMDGGYQFGNAFAPGLKQALGGEMLPTGQLSTMAFFTGIFEGGRWGWQTEGISAGYSYPAQLANYVSPIVSITLLLVLVAIALTVAVWATGRKDVG